jgi:SHAQKYF class myb-like DNA-binding protein
MSSDTPWSADQHREFISAVYEAGLRHSSPGVILHNMQSKDRSMTSERVKSHLQKYRSHRQRNKEEVLSAYDKWMTKVITLIQELRKQRSTVGASMKASLENFPKLSTELREMFDHENQSVGEMIACLSFSIMMKERYLQKSVRNMSAMRNEIQASDIADNSIQDTEHSIKDYLSYQAIYFPTLSAAEKNSPIGKGLEFTKDIFITIREQIEKQRNSRFDDMEESEFKDGKLSLSPHDIRLTKFLTEDMRVKDQESIKYRQEQEILSLWNAAVIARDSSKSKSIKAYPSNTATAMDYSCSEASTSPQTLQMLEAVTTAANAMLHMPTSIQPPYSESNTTPNEFLVPFSRRTRSRSPTSTRYASKMAPPTKKLLSIGHDTGALPGMGLSFNAGLHPHDHLDDVKASRATMSSGDARQRSTNIFPSEEYWQGGRYHEVGYMYDNEMSHSAEAWKIEGGYPGHVLPTVGETIRFPHDDIRRPRTPQYNLQQSYISKNPSFKHPQRPPANSPIWYPEQLHRQHYLHDEHPLHLGNTNKRAVPDEVIDLDSETQEDEEGTMSGRINHMMFSEYGHYDDDIERQEGQIRPGTSPKRRGQER